MEENSYVQKLLAEVLGTGMLVFIGVGSVPATLIVGGDAPFTMAQLGFISLSFALVVVAMIYAIGHISGCQINPAVTIALAATGKMPWRQVPGYLAAQVGGAILGAVAIVGVLGQKSVDVGLGIATYGPSVGAGQAFFAEALGTFILAFVVFGAIDRRAPGGFAGLAIGLAVFAIIIPIAPTTGASINPARTVGPMLVGQVFGGEVQWGQLPVYVAAEVVGAVVAGLVYVAVAVRRTAVADRSAPAPQPTTQPAPQPATAEGVLS
jgi:glycerol uptake facilitator protein